MELSIKFVINSICMKVELNSKWNKGDTEIDLFRKMNLILSMTYNTLFIEETHQRRIDFHSVTINRVVSRELSDLWIITFSPNQKRIRTTFLQAKYHRKNILPSGTFKGDYFQHELLSTRPNLLNGGSFNFPLNILSFSCCNSIGSYGIFYVDNIKSIDMAYCCASNLTSAITPSSYGQISVNLSFPNKTLPTINNCNCNFCSELNYTYDINFFTQNLLQLNIGAEIQFYPNISIFIKNTLQKKIASTEVANLISLIDELSKNSSNNEDSEIFEEGNPNILIINVDEKTATK